MALAPQPELADQRAVALEVVLLEIVEEPAAPADEHQQAAARMMVVLVLAQVLGEMVDAVREQRDLHLRGAGVVLVAPEARDDVALFLCGHRHVRPCRVAAMGSHPACRPSTVGRPPQDPAVVQPAMRAISRTSACICSTRASTDSK